VDSQSGSYEEGSGHGRQPLSGLYMSSSGTREKGSASSATDGSMTWFMKTPSPGWAAMPIHPSPIPRSAWASAMSEPPPELPRSTTASAPRRFISWYTASTSIVHSSCRQSVSFPMYRVPNPHTA
jgi:hypothetical protein